MQAIISLAGKVDPSLAKAIGQVDKQLSRLSKAKAMKSGLSKVGSGIALGAKALATAGAAIGGATASAITAIGGAAVGQYAQYEQMVGGVETLFGAGGKSLDEYAASVGQSVDEASAKYNQLMAAQQAVMSNAASAWNTAGVSANSYMEQATSMSASLIQGLGGDTRAAADMVDLAIKDMSDNANKMGTDLGQIQMTYQSLMRGNYAMLDNLKLGYGGTKSELQRLVKDASELTGEALDPAKFSDVITAIHAVQEHMGITGTTALEAATTIEGSVNSAKAAWDNWLTGLGTDGADMGALTDQLVTSIGNVATNLGPVVQRIASSLAQNLPAAISQAASAMAPAVAEVIAGIFNGVSSALGLGLPQLDASAILDTFTQVASAIGPVIQQMASGFGQLVNTVGPPLVSMLQTIGPLLLNFAQTALPPIASAIGAILPVAMQIVSAVLPPILSILSALMPVIAQVATFLAGVLLSAVTALSPVISALVPIVQMIFSVASSILNGVIIPIISPLMQIVQVLLPPLAGLISALQGPLEVVGGAFQVVCGAVQDLCTWFGNLISKVGEVASAIANSPVGQLVGGIGSLFGFAKGGFTAGPYIAGEDPRYPNEAVISFNPAYRAQNLRYWAMAGHMLGASPARAASVSGGGGGSTTYDFSGMTFAPRVEVRGNASKADIIAAIKECELEFVDTIRDMLARDEEDSYAAA